MPTHNIVFDLNFGDLLSFWSFILWAELEPADGGLLGFPNQIKWGSKLLELAEWELSEWIRPNTFQPSAGHPNEPGPPSGWPTCPNPDQPSENSAESCDSSCTPDDPYLTPVGPCCLNAGAGLHCEHCRLYLVLSPKQIDVLYKP